MVKIKRFETSMFCPNPAKALEKFIAKNNITKDKIVNISTADVNVMGLSKPSCTLTYDDGK